MKNSQLLIILALVVGTACTPARKELAPGEAPKAQDAISNEFQVMGDRSVVSNELKSLGIEARIETFDKELGLHHVVYRGKAPYSKIAKALAPKVDIIEQNTRVQLNAIEEKVEWPEDNYFFYQWSHNNIGQSAPQGLPGKYDADMKILQALQKYQGQLKEDTIVAVIDTGVDYNHSDLNKNMWVNEKEATKNGGLAGRDEDGNGFTDDVYGYDFTSGGRTKPHYGKIGDEDTIDDHGHGTHCAGNIAAVSGNGKGITGANPRAKIMALRALTAQGGSKADIQKAVAYAIQNGANVISASYGGGSDSDITKALIKKAGESGILFVAAAGNDGKTMEIKDNRKYPAGYQLPTLLTVGASDNMDNPANFSNYGHNYVDVFAPGVSILSLVPNEGYAIMDGTSMATPLVAGIASLIMSAHPELKKNPQRVKELILATVDKKASMYGKVKSNGRVNALAALEKANGAVTQTPITWVEDAESVVERKYNTELVDIRKKIVRKGAKALRVHFDFLEIDRSFDSIYIYDKNFKLVSEIQNGSSRDLWSPVVVGDTAIVRFVNAKVKESGGATEVKMSNTDLPKCLEAGGDNLGPVVGADPLAPSTEFVCLQDNIEYKYEELKNGIDDKEVFFSWKSEGFSIDKIEYTETEI